LEVHVARINRADMEGLRSSDPVTLSVLCQDLLRRPLIQLTPRTLCDLLALSEIEDLPKQLRRDLFVFREQMVREFNDMPEGLVIGEYLEELTEMDPGQIPDCLRVAVIERGEAAARHPASAPHIEALLTSFEEHEAEFLDPGGKAQKVKVHQFDVPDSHKAPDERSKKKRTRSPRAESEEEGGDTPARKSSYKGNPTTKLPMRSSKDPERALWIRMDINERLGNHSKGLKQAVLLAGARHRCPWDDLAGEEVLAVLRAMAREGKVKNSAGRWMMVNLRGW
jgi:hypothetical protein